MFANNRKRKSITRKLLESFRESPASTDKKDQIFAEYVKNKLTDGDTEDRLFNNIKGNYKVSSSWLDLKLALFS